MHPEDKMTFSEIRKYLRSCKNATSSLLTGEKDQSS